MKEGQLYTDIEIIAQRKWFRENLKCNWVKSITVWLFRRQPESILYISPMQFMRRIVVVLGKQTESSSLKKSGEKKKLEMWLKHPKTVIHATLTTMNLYVWNWWKSKMSRKMPFIVYALSFSSSFNLSHRICAFVLNNFFFYLFSFLYLLNLFFAPSFRMPNPKWLVFENAGVRYLTRWIDLKKSDESVQARNKKTNVNNETYLFEMAYSAFAVLPTNWIGSGKLMAICIANFCHS